MHGGLRDGRAESSGGALQLPCFREQSGQLQLANRLWQQVKELEKKRCHQCFGRCGRKSRAVLWRSLSRDILHILLI